MQMAKGQSLEKISLQMLPFIQRQYFQAVPLKLFDWRKLNSDRSFSLPNDVLNATIRHPLSQRYSLSNSYKLAFLKALLKLYEDLGWEISDEFYDCIADLMSKKKSYDGFLFKSYILPCGKAITVCESEQIISQGTTGLNTWQASVYLSNWLLQNTNLLQGKNVLELGCGIGLAGLVALHTCQPKTYFFTDCHEEVLRKVRENLQVNGFHSLPGVDIDRRESREQFHCEEKMKFSNSGKQYFYPLLSPLVGQLGAVSSSEPEVKDKKESSLMVFKDVQRFPPYERAEVGLACITCGTRGTRNVKERSCAAVCQLDWEKWTQKEVKSFHPDIILASDVIFDPRLILPLVDVIKALLSDGDGDGGGDGDDGGGDQKEKPTAYIATTVRNQDTFEKFMQCLGEKKMLYIEELTLTLGKWILSLLPASFFLDVSLV